MGFLNPLFLLAGGLTLVPILLHFFYRQESKTFQFPAILYLLRTERDHAKQIRTQQLMLLLVRIALLILLVLAGARIHFPGPGGAHEATALALILDNSTSTTVVEEGSLLLDRLKAAARESALAAGHDDLLWVISAGTHWETAAPGSGQDALRHIDDVEPGHGRGDLDAALRRAMALVGQSDLPGKEIHLFTDLQASAFSGGTIGDGSIPVVVYRPPEPELDNRGIGSVIVGGGLPPLAGRRTEAVVQVLGGRPGDTVGVRLYIDDEVRAATRAPVGSDVRLPIGPFPTGRITGFAEIDPDRLAADDRFYFTLSVRDPTPVAAVGDGPMFVAEALSVLEDDGRILRTGPGASRAILSAGGAGLGGRDRTQSAIVYPLADEARLPALNRALVEAGVPFRYELPEGTGGRVSESGVPGALTELEIYRYYRLSRLEDEGGVFAATLSNGDPWIVSGRSASGPYVLFASPFDETSTTLPISAGMIPVLEWAVEEGTLGPPSRDFLAGEPYLPPSGTSHVAAPDGALIAIDGNRPLTATREAGLYEARRLDESLEYAAANPPPAEGDLTRLTDRDLGRILPGLSDATGS
ncbi:MAG: BatA domain-containing protein, partial [Gemmatimonadota bacterium]|nr:BatA domain-containing protein [Gemmatimonadota bacterium]